MLVKSPAFAIDQLFLSIANMHEITSHDPPLPADGSARVSQPRRPISFSAIPSFNIDLGPGLGSFRAKQKRKPPTVAMEPYLIENQS